MEVGCSRKNNSAALLIHQCSSQPSTASSSESNPKSLYQKIPSGQKHSLSQDPQWVLATKLKAWNLTAFGINLSQSIKVN